MEKITGQYFLILLNSYAQIKKGDILINQPNLFFGGGNYKTAVILDTSDNRAIEQTEPGDGNIMMQGDDIKNIALLRKTKNNLEILAGKKLMKFFK